MKTLYLDTSSSYIFMGIMLDDNTFFEIKELLGKDLSKVALVKVKELFDKAGIFPDDIDKIIVVNGPGSFTGIRIGLTIAKTYAWGLHKKISTISSLEAMAVSNLCDENRLIVPIIDARRDCVFAAIFDNKLNVVLPEQYVAISKLEEKIKDLGIKAVVVTNDNINTFVDKTNYNPDIRKIIHTFVDKENINPHGIDANYLKLTEAEENLHDRNS